MVANAGTDRVDRDLRAATPDVQDWLPSAFAYWRQPNWTFNIDWHETLAEELKNVPRTDPQPASVRLRCRQSAPNGGSPTRQT